MQVTGVQPVGTRGINTMQAVVSDERSVRGGFGARADVGHAEVKLQPGARLVTEQPVVFPRDGLPLDHRPLPLRQTRAAERYRADGAPDGEPQPAPGAPNPRRAARG